MHQNNLIPSGFVAITPSDTTFVNLVGVVAGVAGNIAVLDGLGVTTTIPVVAGQVVPGKIVKVMSTNTTATGIVGFVA